MPENISPEEKLLNLIKNGKRLEKDKETHSRVEETSATKGEVGEERTEQLTPTVIKKRRREFPNLLSALNRVLALVMLGVLVYMVLGYIFPYKSKTEIPEQIDISKIPEVGEEHIGELPPLSDYTRLLSRRQMFKVYEPPKPKPVGAPKPKVTLQQLLGGYTFVGIIFGEPPQAIVEEKRSKQSYYLSAGQYLGEIKIEKIERGKVTVSYGDETMDIRI